jgi:hypothetical protein
MSLKPAVIRDVSADARIDDKGDRSQSGWSDERNDYADLLDG